VTTPQNEYSYHAQNLLIAYGVGFFVTLVTVAIGLFVFWQAAHSFTSSFSTFLRTTRNPDLDALVPAAQTTGACPTSKSNQQQEDRAAEAEPCRQ
jgi:hypothetical protein